MLQLKLRPIVVMIAGDGYELYKSGTFVALTKTKGYYGAVLVAYDNKKGFMIRNNIFGHTWGNQGYGYVDETTDICRWASYPILGKDG